jgi:hypothetical protein
MEIPVGAKYIITSDDYNIVVKKKRILTNQKTNEKYEDWSNARYFMTIEQACKYILKDRVRASDATTLKEILQEVKETKHLIEESLDVSDSGETFRI